MNLPVLSCQSCGTCCTHVGTPPGYAPYFSPFPVPRWAEGTEDHRRALAMPESLRLEMMEYYLGVFAGAIEDRSGDDCPCLWYDPATRSCKHYDHRPDICRGFEVGGVECLRMRTEDGIR